MNFKVHVNGHAVRQTQYTRHKYRTLKYLIAMKLFIAILIISVNASANAYSQKVDLTATNAPFREVMKQVRKQTGYYFFFATSILQNAKPVTVHLKQVSVEDALKAIFKDQPFTYQISGKSITVEEKQSPGFIENVMNVLNFLTITGKVTDEQGQPLPGASVRASGKTTITNDKGEFTLEGIDGHSIMEISYVGYTTKILKAGNGEFMLVQLSSKAGQLDETVIKGYYNTTRLLNTGSVGSVKAAEIARQPVSDPLMALEGRVAGLYVSQTSGVPGANLKVNIRGINSISNGNDPLYIIDGIQFNSKSLSQVVNENGVASAAGYQALSPFANIRPEDIERIDVLKDADATAIYGSRGANGVILITTKRGRSGKTKVNVNVYAGTGKVTRTLNLMNTQQYLEMRREGLQNENKNPEPFEYDINGTWNPDRYTDWQKVMIGGLSNVQNASASISGGTEQTQFLIGLGYRRETTVFPGDFNNQIGSANFNITHESESKKFRVSLSSNYANNNNLLPQTDFTSLIYMSPNAPALYDKKGQLNWEKGTFQNPFGQLLQKSTSVTENLINNLTSTYTIIKGLQLKASIGYNSIKFNENLITPLVSLNPSLYGSDDPAPYRSTDVGINSIKSWTIEPQISYIKKLDRNHFEVLVGSTYQQSSQNGLTQRASGFSSDVLIENVGAATFITSNSSYSQYRYNALFARIGYNYDEKYILNLTGRRDGSSRFGLGQQFGNFGAVGVAWIFTKENWVSEKFPFITLGKIRGSIGRTGNDQISDYNYLSTYIPETGYLGTSGLTPYKLANPNYRWETINKIEAALELGFINNRILLNTSFYRNRTSNQLVGYSLPVVTGFNNIIANLPAVIQNKGLEIDLTTSNIKSQSFAWTTTANISIPANKLVAYPNIEGSSYARIYSVGQPLTGKYSYKYSGIDPNTGLYTVEDLDKSGNITSAKDRYFLFTGRKYFGAISNSFAYKGLSLDVSFQFVKQVGNQFLGNTAAGRYLVTGSNMPTELLDRWKNPSDIAKYQKYSSSANNSNTAFSRYSLSDARITDASFIRLKNISLSWQLPSQWTNSVKLNSVRVYTQTQNLLTFTSFKGLDPENQTGSSPSLPPLKVITAGIQLLL